MKYPMTVTTKPPSVTPIDIFLITKTLFLLMCSSVLILTENSNSVLIVPSLGTAMIVVF